jgi:hypothetical protein
MNPTSTTEELSQRDVARLLREVERYLVAVETFRDEGCEPVWRDDEMFGEQWPLVCRPDLAAGPVSVDSQ